MNPSLPRLRALLLLLTGAIASAGADGRVALPDAGPESTMPLERAITERRSVRSFAERPLTLEQVARILWAGGGVSADIFSVDAVSGPTRAVPSAGGLYPCVLYLVAGRVEGLEPGVYRCLEREHELERIKGGDWRQPLGGAALGQGFVAAAPACVVITAVVQRTKLKYGERGATRFVPMDAAHAAQNIALQCVALGLGTTTVGAFNEAGVAGVLGATGEEPYYLLPIGWPR